MDKEFLEGLNLSPETVDTIMNEYNTQTFRTAAKSFFDNVKFSSNAARKSALADFFDSNSSLDTADEFLASLRKDDPSAFAETPKFTKPITPPSQNGSPKVNLSGYNCVR